MIVAEVAARGLRAPDGTPLGLHSHVDEAEGDLIRRVITEVQPSTYLEVGLAYGMSALYATEALRALGRPYTHIVVDAFQRRDWHGVGLALLERHAGKDRVRFLEERSEYALPRLAEQGLVVDAAFIDGWHSFDQVAVDFYYVHRMLRVGGVAMLDDADWPSASSSASSARCPATNSATPPRSRACRRCGPLGSGCGAAIPKAIRARWPCARSPRTTGRTGSFGLSDPAPRASSGTGAPAPEPAPKA
jgi:predicted O-methyltransferase YrrM